MLYVCAPYAIASGILLLLGCWSAVLWDQYQVWHWQRVLGYVLPALAFILFLADAAGLTH